MIEHAEIQHNIQDLSFKSMIARRLTNFIQLSQLLLKADKTGKLSRDFLGTYHIESIKVEEFLDLHGALNNRSWHSFRECAASIKMFSLVLYILIHRSKSVHTANFSSVYENYHQKTIRIVEILKESLCNIATRLCTLADEFEINYHTFIEINVTEKNHDQFQLEQNRDLRNIKDPEKVVVQLASQFLNYGETDFLKEVHGITDPVELAELIPCSINEEKLRFLESNFHSLQSQYDTYISNTNIENLDTNLPTLRSYITLIYRLLEVATHISHYYERHQRHTSAANSYLSSELSLEILFGYCLHFVQKFTLTARNLCQEMIKAYAEQGEISVFIPPYRGFHVRPSTLIAKIVLHYGSNIDLFLSNNRYDASNPLELFRANEEINAAKRKALLEFIGNVVSYKQEYVITVEDFAHNLNRLVFKLMESNKIMLYDNDFSSREINIIEGESFCEYAKRGIAKLLALGCIDIQIEMKVQFKGDKRVLKDIEALAETGYGENLHGNNIMLPKSLSYLRR